MNNSLKAESLDVSQEAEITGSIGRTSFWDYFKSQSAVNPNPSRHSKLILNDLFKYAFRLRSQQKNNYVQRGYQDDGTVQNIKIVMRSKPSEIIYCENSKMDPVFLLKYFKY